MSELPAQFIINSRSITTQRCSTASRGRRSRRIIEFDGCDNRPRRLALALQALILNEELKPCGSGEVVH